MPVPPPSASRLTLVTGPPGSGKSEVVLARIRDAATTAGPRGRGAAGAASALLIVPTYAALQHTLRAALARWDARGLFDEVFATFTSAGERFLPGFRVRSLPSRHERDRLLAAALERADPAVFRTLRTARGLHARLLRLLKEVKQGAAPPGEALAALAARAARLGGAARERLEGFLAVARAYGEALAAAGLEDHEDALHRLLAGLRGADAATRTPDLLAVDGFDDLTPVEEEILAALVARMRAAGGEVVVTLPFDPTRPGLYASTDGLRARLLGAGFVHRPLEGFPRAPGGALEHLARHAFGPPSPRAAGGEEVTLFEALDAEDEADLVAREVRTLLEGAGGAGSPVRGARDVLVVVPDLERRSPRLEAALERLGVPVHREGTRALAAAPWARSLGGVLDVLGGRVGPGELAAADLLDGLRWRALAGAAPPPAAVDEQEMRWRAHGFPAGWEALRAAADAPLAEVLALLEAQRSAFARPHDAPAAALLAALDVLLPMPPPGGLGEDGRPLHPEHDRRLAAALAARSAVRALVEERVGAAARLAALPTPAEAARDLRDALEDAGVAASDRRLDAVHVVDPERARSWEATTVFLVGLDEDGFPRRPAEDPLLGDEDRARLADGDTALPTSAQQAARERRLALSAVTRARRRLVLVRATRTADGEDLPHSPLLAEILERVDAPARRAPPGPLETVPALAACRTRHDLLRHAAARLRAAQGAGDAAVARGLLQRLDPDLLRRAGRWHRRAADALPAEARARLAASVARVSATSLNAADGCLHRHFLQRVLGLGRRDAPLAGPRFDALELGSLVHAALERALRAPGEDAEAVAEAALADHGVAGFEREHARREIARMIRLLREREAATAGPLRPLVPLLEHRLGGGDEGVVLGEGAGAFRLTGSIDRVDGSGSSVVVVDYKAGDTLPYRRRVLAGEDLQLPLYARALEREGGRTVVGLEWVSTRRRIRATLVREGAEPLVAPRRERHAAEALPPEAWAGLLEGAERHAATLVARIREGAHDLAPRDPALCGACDVASACRPDRAHLRALALAAGRRPADDEEDAP